MGKFDALALPTLQSQCQQLDHVIYHLDGPEEIPHLKSLLRIPELDGIQWIPGEHRSNTGDPQWLPLYKQIQDADKLLVLDKVPFSRVHALLDQLSPKGLLIQTVAPTQQDAELLLQNS